MTTEIQNIEHLLSDAGIEYNYIRNFISSNNDFITKSFDSTYEHIFDIYNQRWQHLKQQGISITGMDKLIENLHNSTNVTNIKTTILSTKNEKIAIFSDLDCKILLGIIYFNDAK